MWGGIFPTQSKVILPGFMRSKMLEKERETSGIVGVW